MVSPVMIGADPEFEIHNPHGLVPACERFSDRNYTAELGTDEASRTG